MTRATPDDLPAQPAPNGHYAAQAIEARILAALRSAGLDPTQRLSPVVLAALDHFHTGGWRASLALRAQARIASGEHVLDVGAGLAGPARMLAAAPGCRVDCIELSPDYCVGARLLNRLTGLEDAVAVHQGSALDLPFADDSFDVAWMQNVGMNIEDKPRLYAEMHRVLKKGGAGGRFAFQEMTAGERPASRYPLPWASDASSNFLIDMEAMRALLTRCGFVEESFEDVSEQPLPALADGTAESAPQAPLSLSAYVDDLALKADNATRSLKEREIRLVRGVFRAV
jgi:ubiquinone/menaquinone biosynthesis C-methylase UbiE